jgi:DNA repair photolyase
VSLDEEFRERMEPGAVLIADRLAALRALHDAGCKTWVSMEPYPTPNVWEQDLRPILEAVAFVDRIVFGRVHYDRRTSAYKDLDAYYHDCAAQVRGFCDEHGISCHIKTGTAD